MLFNRVQPKLYFERVTEGVIKIKDNIMVSALLPTSIHFFTFYILIYNIKDLEMTVVVKGFLRTHCIQ